MSVALVAGAGALVIGVRLCLARPRRTRKDARRLGVDCPVLVLSAVGAKPQGSIGCRKGVPQACDMAVGLLCGAQAARSTRHLLRS